MLSTPCSGLKTPLIPPKSTTGSGAQEQSKPALEAMTDSTKSPLQQLLRLDRLYDTALDQERSPDAQTSGTGVSTPTPYSPPLLLLFRLRLAQPVPHAHITNSIRAVGPGSPDHNLPPLAPG